MLLATALLVACSKKSSDIVPELPAAKIASVAIKTSQAAGTYWMGESAPLTLSVELKDEKGNAITNYKGKITYYANDKELTSSQFNFDTEGLFTFKAQVEGIQSAALGTFTVKNTEKELDRITLVSGYYQKYAVWHALVGIQPQITVRGISKSGQEIPIKQGVKAIVNNANTALENLIFQQVGTQKIVVNAYGKQAEMTFQVRSNRTFEVVRIPVVFHFCKPSPYTHPATKQTDAEFIELAIEQLKNGKKMAQLNAMFRNQFVKNVNELDPNAADTFIEFYLADKDPNGNPLKEVGVNRLNFMRPYIPVEAPYVYDDNQRQYEITLANELAKWNPNAYFNVVVENFGNWNYAGVAKMPMMDNNRKSVVPQEFFSLPYINTNIDKLAWGNTNTRIYSDHVRLQGAIKVLTESPGVDGRMSVNSTLMHEIGHAFGLQHTFGLQENCQDQVHSDGLYDTPRQISTNYETSCDGIRFAQRNLMNYMYTDNRGYFTYDQVTVMRSRIEAAFNIPTPRNRGKANGRLAAGEEPKIFGMGFAISCGHTH